MDLAGRGARARRPLVLAALVALGLAAALSVTQCRMVSDHLTGFDVSRLKAQPANCIARCSVAYADSNQAESQLHTDNVMACAGDSLCLALEDLRHDAAMDRIDAGRQQCKDDCYHEGGGGGS